MAAGMRVLALALTLVLASVSVAGCSGAKDANPSGGADEDMSATHGTVVGLITDDEARPIEEVTVGLRTVKVSPIAIKIFSNTEGRFRIENVPAGRQTVVAEKNGYLDTETTITVLPGAENPVRIVLQPRPIDVYEVDYLGVFKGHYDCAAEVFLSSGSCDYEVKNHTGVAPLQTTNNHTLNVPAGWGGLLFEVKWQTGTVDGTMEGIRFQLESQEDIGGMFLRQYGTRSPMRIEVNAGQVAPDATLGYPIPSRGVATWMHVLPLGHADGASCPAQCGYGVGFALNLDYEVHVTVFYGGPVDKNYAALPPP